METHQQQFGREGEGLARQHLESLGYTIIGTNYTTRYGEIDLVAQKGKNIYFVEIRSRQGREYGSALESIDARKVHHIKRSTESLLMKHPAWQKMVPFLSVIAIDVDGTGKPHIEFLPDAITD
jgi:putative endonuclease